MVDKPQQKGVTMGKKRAKAFDKMFQEGRLVGYGEGWAECRATMLKQGYAMPKGKKGKKGGRK